MHHPHSGTPPGARRPAIPVTVWMLGVVSLLMDVSSEMVQTLLPLYLVGSLGASAMLVGFIEGLSVAVATATKFLSGLFVDWSRRSKPLAVLGYGLGALSRLFFPLAASVDLIILAKAMDRVGKGIRGTPRDAMVAAVSPPEIRGASFGLRKSLDTVGGFVGPLLAVLVMMLMAGDIVTVFWLAAIPAALAMAVLIFGVREPAENGAAKRAGFRLSQALQLNRAVWGVIGIASVIMLARFSEAFVLLKSLEAGFSPTWVPLSMVIMHAVYGLAAYPVGRLSDRIGTTGLLLWSLAFLAAAHLVLAFAGSAWVYILGTVFWGLHMGFSQGLLGAMIAGATPDGLKGSAFGAFNLTTGAVVLLGNTAAGWFWQSFGSAVPFLVGAGLSLLAMLLLAIGGRRRVAA
ncbi:MFS transporter [Roseomonas aerophila]|uniref:MFS transporter n=1 Tax=Teichococcus aerophilus TaxID=1224513 RepID=A0ABR7RLR1_9PROT|nr:MFS transporter [Pseudoroseomonas aerophila]MBC9207070.1 MFS transporter [Pseudoroseomonas aerophila]